MVRTAKRRYMFCRNIILVRLTSKETRSVADMIMDRLPTENNKKAFMDNLELGGPSFLACRNGRFAYLATYSEVHKWAKKFDTGK